MKEYLSIPEKGIFGAGVVHLVSESVPDRQPLKFCTGEPYTPPDETVKQIVFCEACRSAGLRWREVRHG